MIFYKRYVARIQIATGHLTPCEFGVYDRLLDHYYAKEEPLPTELSRCCAIAGAQTKADRVAVAAVLAEFFEQDDAGRWHQKTANEMIAEAQPKIEAARQNGKLGGRPSKANLTARAALQEPVGFSLGSDSEPNLKASQRQNQNGSEAKASAAADASAAVDKSTNTEPPAVDRRWLWATAKALLVEAGSSEEAAREFMGSLVKDFTEPVAFQAVSSANAANLKPINPKAWLIATCKALKAKPAGGQYETAEETRARLDEDSKRATSTPEEIAAIKARAAGATA